MAVIYPFRALRPPVEQVEEVASVPYDVVNTAEARALAADNPLSLLHVTRPEIDLPDGTDIYSDAVYAQAGANFQKLIADCPLEEEAAPSLYLYRLVMGAHEQIGIAACCAVDEYDNDLIRNFSQDGGEAIGQRMIVYGQVLDENARPVGGTLVCFLSAETGHEVLLCHAARLSFTGWFKR